MLKALAILSTVSKEGFLMPLSRSFKVVFDSAVISANLRNEMLRFSRSIFNFSPIVIGIPPSKYFIALIIQHLSAFVKAFTQKHL